MSFLSRLVRGFKRRKTTSQGKRPKNEPNDSSNAGCMPSGAAQNVGDGESTNIAQHTAASHPKSGTSSPNDFTNPTATNEVSLVNILSNAQNVQFRGTTYIGGSTMVVGGDSAMDKLQSRTDPNAAVDSSSRHPPPTCHPRTRREIRGRLAVLFDDEHRKYRMVWLFGAAGTGKTAVGQTFSTKCLEKHRLGAAFFFSRPNNRNRYKTVIPSLAYQLATRCPVYRLALITRIDYDPQILDKTPPIQLMKLVVEPLLEVQSQIRTTYLMLLDGIDECGANMEDAHEREREQCEVVKMIADTVRDYRDLPLFWLLCSRPEEHLQNVFADNATICQQEELVIDTKCREEVEMVLREGFIEIAKKRRIIFPGPGGWPPKDEFDKVERAVCGLHVFGAAILRDIESSNNPVNQLKSLIPFLEHVADTGSTRSIADMDLFYIRILNDVHKEDLPTTLRIIGALITMRNPHQLSAQGLCNFLNLDPNEFFSALRKLHSVINVPCGEAAYTRHLQFYHASFSDFITDASRSKGFFVEKMESRVDIAKQCLFWHELHSNLFHSSDRPLISHFVMRHDHEPLPRAHLKWITTSINHQAISLMLCRYAEVYCFQNYNVLTQRNEELLSAVYNFDLRHTSSYSLTEVAAFLNWTYKQDPSSGFVRTEPDSDEDRILLTYLETVTKEPVDPVRFPINWDFSRKGAFREYVIIGRNSRSIIVWATGIATGCKMMALNLDREPDELIIQEYENSIGCRVWKSLMGKQRDETG